MSSRRLQNAPFQQALIKNGFDLEDPKIFDQIRIKVLQVPNSDLLIDIPQQECFPKKRIPTQKEIDFQELTHEFAKLSFQSLASSSHKHFPRDLVETKTQIFSRGFEKSEEFVEFKRKIRTYFKAFSEQSQLDDEFDVCSETGCIHSAIPTFNYCFSHLVMDPKFNQLKFLCQCEYAENGKKCSLPTLTKNQAFMHS
jgi:hypothetical protein